MQPIDKGGQQGRRQGITAETARDISNYFLSGPQHVLYRDFGGDENFHVVMADITTGKVQT